MNLEQEKFKLGEKSPNREQPEIAVPRTEVEGISIEQRGDEIPPIPDDRLGVEVEDLSTDTETISTRVREERAKVDPAEDANALYHQYNSLGQENGDNADMAHKAVLELQDIIKAA